MGVQEGKKGGRREVPALVSKTGACQCSLRLGDGTSWEAEGAVVSCAYSGPMVHISRGCVLLRTDDFVVPILKK